ncbi:peptidase T-like protein [Alkalithermobacter thermoalcaliphilus JW-YL-7 = DSM 7308]|uniref:Peptidase T-like protein n=2 Tax=Clostridium paradoxum TaxID=29346 RepID=A0A150FSN1_CLOPD|nr:peptidase T-like protein [[Clostridium] paradoxum JW-YL-7 = DSM 7308]SHK68903.1 peptidase T-like protein [[Clostridium] paradoxum JW-YL-7 = DSM 7308]
MVNKDRIVNEFIELVKIDSPSSKEEKIAKVLVEKLEKLGFEVVIDDAGTKVGGQTGNVIATLKGTRPGKKILFSAHMDTVSPGEGVNPIIDEENGIIKSDETTVLGADDKGGIAAILEGIRILKEKNEDHGDIQVVFSIWEEGGLFGAKYLDYSKIDAEYAFVLDSGGSPGEIIVKGPAQDKIDVKIIGKPAHAGVAPEEGVSAIMVAARAIENMKLLRIDEDTTANIGIVKGGIATNIVMPELEIKAESRSLVDEKLDMQTKHMVETFKKAAEDSNAQVEINVERMYGAFNISEDDEIITMLKKAFENMGVKSYITSTGGGSDTNILNSNGIKAVNLGIGMKKPHTLQEYIAIEDLVKSAQMVYEIIKQA